MQLEKAARPSQRGGIAEQAKASATRSDREREEVEEKAIETPGGGEAGEATESKTQAGDVAAAARATARGDGEVCCALCHE